MKSLITSDRGTSSSSHRFFRRAKVASETAADTIVYSGDEVCRQWCWPHRKKLPPIDIGRILTADEHMQRQRRLCWDGKWRDRPVKAHHAEYHNVELRDAYDRAGVPFGTALSGDIHIDSDPDDTCESRGHQSVRLSDESNDVHIADGPTDDISEAPDEDADRWYWDGPGMRVHASAGKVDWLYGEARPVDDKEIAGFAEEELKLRTRLRHRAPPRKPARYWQQLAERYRQRSPFLRAA
jgi:hypothetical protein